MRILIAPDKFKGSLSALQVCEALKKGIHRQDSNIKIDFHPLADGGDGSLTILKPILDLKAVDIQVQDPLGRPIMAQYFINDKAAFIELAAASGYVLLKNEEKNPRLTSTYGTGQMLRHALQAGFSEVYIFLGGSATSDAGMGLASALGYIFLDKNGNKIKPNGENLLKIAKIDTSQVAFDFSKTNITALCDVANPLYGSNGAAYVYAPQKGANPEDVVVLDNGLRNLARNFRKDFKKNLQRIKGGGAAGGIGAGLVGFCNAKLRPGTLTIMRLTGFEKKVKAADWIISGEGRLDRQTLEGKVIHGVLNIAHKYEKKTALFVGSNLLTDFELANAGADYVAAVMDVAPSLSLALEAGAGYLETLGFEFAKKLD